MSKLKFHTIFSVLNVFIFVFFVSCISIFFIVLLSTNSNISLFCTLLFFVLYIALKLNLPKIFINLSNKYKNSWINKFVEYLRNNLSEKNRILFFVICFDILCLIIYRSGFVNELHIFVWLYFYFILYAGGLLFFYIMLYREILISEGKLERFF